MAEQEFETLRTIFNDAVDIDEGSSTAKLALQPEDDAMEFIRVELAIKLPANYPEEAACCSCNVWGEHEDEAESLEQELQELAEERAEMACESGYEIVEHARMWMYDRNHPRGRCIICLAWMHNPHDSAVPDDDINEDSVCVLPCGHCFHEECAAHWAATTQLASEISASQPNSSSEQLPGQPCAYCRQRYDADQLGIGNMLHEFYLAARMEHEEQLRQEAEQKIEALARLQAQKDEDKQRQLNEQETKYNSDPPPVLAFCGMASVNDVKTFQHALSRYKPTSVSGVVQNCKFMGYCLARFEDWTAADKVLKNLSAGGLNGATVVKASWMQATKRADHRLTKAQKKKLKTNSTQGNSAPKAILPAQP